MTRLAEMSLNPFIGNWLFPPADDDGTVYPQPGMEFLKGLNDTCIEYARRLNMKYLPTCSTIPMPPIPNPLYYPIDQYFRDGQYDPDNPDIGISRGFFLFSDTAA